MFSTLATADLIAYEKYRGALLTGEGERIASRILRNRRLLEAYLTTELGYRSSETRDEVDRLEHHISDRLATRLAASLDDSNLDPLDDSIPAPSLELLAGRGERLATADEGSTVFVRDVVGCDDETLDALSVHHITSGSPLTIVDGSPFGTVTVRHEETAERIPLPDDVARLVRVTNEPPPGNN